MATTCVLINLCELNWSLDGAPNGHKTILNKRSNKSLAIQFPRKFSNFLLFILKAWILWFSLELRKTSTRRCGVPNTNKLPTHREIVRVEKYVKLSVGGVNSGNFDSHSERGTKTPCWNGNPSEFFTWSMLNWREKPKGALSLLMSWHDSDSMCKVN